MMTQPPGLFRRIYDGAALFALLNMVALTGMIAYLAGFGVVDGPKLRAAALALRGVPLAAPKAPSSEALQPKPDAPPAAVAQGVETEVDAEIAYRDADRIKTELRQRLALNNSILLRVREEREALKLERESAAQQTQAAAAAQRDEGFRKQVEIFEALSPKVALQHLLSMPDVVEAAKILMTLDTAKARKIVESAKRGDEMNQMKTILQKVREVAPTRVAALNADEE